jgi:hypothetical protein
VFGIQQSSDVMSGDCFAVMVGLHIKINGLVLPFMEIRPHRQSLTHSCLAVCFLMLEQAKHDLEYTEEIEQMMAVRGSKRIYPFYVVGITAEMAKEYGSNIKIFVDNKYFTKVLIKSFEEQKNITVEHTKINPKCIQKLLLNGPLICHIDGHAFGDYSHTSHFLVIEKMAEEKYVVINPWDGKRRKVDVEVIEATLTGLKDYVRMCPILFQLA